MKKFPSIMCSTILLFASILMTGCTAELEPKPKSKPEAEQVMRIRQFFKDKEPVPPNYGNIIKKGDAQFREQLLKGWSIGEGHTKRNLSTTREVDEKFYQGFTKRVRGFEGNGKHNIYTFSDWVPRIGVGFTLIMKISKGKWKAYDRDLLQSLGIPLSAAEYKLIEEYADLKSRNGFPSDKLYPALENMKVRINAQTEERLLRYAVEERYEIIKRAIGKDTWDQLGFARKMGIMDFCYQYGHIMPLVDALKKGDFNEVADEMQRYDKIAQGKQLRTYYSEITEEEIQFREQLLKDFTLQKGIEYVEPIAVGKSIHDPQIAKFNTACPHKKPINIYREWLIFGPVEQPQPSEEELEDPKNEYANITYEYKCTGNLKVYRFNVYNTPNNQQDYVLYCDDFVEIRSMGKILDEKKDRDLYYNQGAYLQFSPGKCLYSSSIRNTINPNRKNSMTGIFKYKENYYFYAIDTDQKSWMDNKEVTSLLIWKEGINGIFCGNDYIMKGASK